MWSILLPCWYLHLPYGHRNKQESYWRFVGSRDDVKRRKLGVIQTAHSALLTEVLEQAMCPPFWLSERQTDGKVGKNKASHKGGRKGAKKIVVDPFLRKTAGCESTSYVQYKGIVGKALTTRTQGNKITSDGPQRLCFWMNLLIYRMMKLPLDLSATTEDVQGKTWLRLHGSYSDKMCSTVKKWQTMTEAHVYINVLHLFSHVFY